MGPWLVLVFPCFRENVVSTCKIVSIFDLLYIFFSLQGKVTKNFISLTYTYFAHPIDFFALPILKKIWIYQVRFLFGMRPGVDSYLCHFGTINK